MTRRIYDHQRDLLPNHSLGRGPHVTPETTRIRPLRDTGLVLGQNRPTRRNRRGRGPRRSILPRLAGIGLVAALVAGVSFAIDRANAGDAGRSSSDKKLAYSVELLPDPTPLFATYRSLQLHLPLLPESVTAVAFHQASGSDALHVKSLVPDADMTAAANGRAQLKPVSAREGADGISTVLQGTVLRMWRSSRSGKPDSACDVGGKPGSVVYAPVSGTVAHVERYKLYGKYPDYEVHITPDGWPEVDVVLIHIQDVAVHEGDRVEAGASAVAKVRKLSDRVAHQLRTYTGDGGDHVHVQLNRVEVPGKVQRVGES